MIRRLMAGTAMLALVTAGAWSANAQTDTTTTTQPAVIEQPAAKTDQATTAAAPDTTATSSDTAAAPADAKLTPDQPTLATAFIGRSVYSSEDPESDNIGDVNDLIIGDNGEISDAIVGVGGFLGIGEKDVAVPFKDLQVVERDGDIRLIYSATKEQLEAAEAFDRTAFDPRARFQKEQAANAPAADTTGAGGLTPVPAPAGDVTATAPAADTTGAASADDMAAAPATDTSGTASTDNTMAAAPATDGTTTTATAEQPATDQQAAAGSEAFVSFNADQMRASKLMGKELYGPDDESIGEVSDLVLQEDGKTRAALVDVGGFLGVGEKRVAIPFDQIKVSPDSQDNSEPKLTVAMTKDQLQQAPEWKDRTMGSDQADNATADQNAAAPTTDQANNAAAGQNATTAMQDISADKLIGTKVYGPKDDNIGEVGDVVFDKTGDIEAVVIDVGGFLGMGEKPVAVQFDALNVQKDTNGDVKLMIDASEDQLKNAPAYDANAAADSQTTVQ